MGGGEGQAECARGSCGRSGDSHSPLQVPKWGAQAPTAHTPEARRQTSSRRWQGPLPKGHPEASTGRRTEAPRAPQTPPGDSLDLRTDGGNTNRNKRGKANDHFGKKGAASALRGLKGTQLELRVMSRYLGDRRPVAAYEGSPRCSGRGETSRNFTLLHRDAEREK